VRFFILASQSKRRVEILKMLGYHFFVVPSLAQERNEGEPLIVARRNAYDKAFKVWKEYKFATVLGADTVVVWAINSWESQRTKSTQRLCFWIFRASGTK
jgi:septum formation protein